MPIDPSNFTDALSETITNLLNWIPAVAGALLLLALGWIIARVSQFILDNLLRRVGLDRISERAGVSRLLTDSGLHPSASRLIARVVYWIILLVFVLAAAESLGLEAVANTLSALIAYLPNVLAAALILVIGGLIARLVGDALGALAVQSGLTSGKQLGSAIRYILIIIVIILALGQLGVEILLISMVTIVIIAAIAVALALSLGIGSREIASNIMAGMHAKELFREGQILSVQDTKGQLVNIGLVKVKIITEEGLVTLPNRVLTEEQVVVLHAMGDSESGSKEL